MQDDRPVVSKVLVCGRHREIGLELEHAARNVHRARRLAGLREFGAVAHVEQQRAFGDHVLRFLAGDFRNRRVGGVEQLLGGDGHGAFLCVSL